MNLVPEVKPGALSGTYVLEERSSNFVNMVSFGNPQSVGFKKRLIKQADRHYTELPSLSNLDELLERSRPPDTRPEEEVVVPIRGPPEARLSIASFRRLLRPDSNSTSRWEQEIKDVPLQWHLFLLKASFNGQMKALKVNTVANWLVEVLNMVPEEARKCAQAATAHPMVRIGTFDEWKVVEEKVESLRALGLAIQVGSASTNAAIVSNRGARQGRVAKENYMEIFDQVPGHNRSPRPPRRSPTPAKSHHHRAKWRGMSQHVVMDVLSKDPVKQLLPDEGLAEYFGSQSEAEWKEWKMAKARKKTVKKILLKHPRKGDRIGTSVKTESDQDASDKTTLGEKTTFSFRNSVLETRKKMSKIVELAQANNNLLTPQRKEACQMLRFFVFGAVGNEQAKREEKDAIFEQRLGERWQVQLLYNLWEKLDSDHSGRCDFGELNAFAEERLKDLVEAALSRGRGLGGLPAWAVESVEDVAKAANKLTKTLEQMLFASKSSFVLEDMMRILWPASQLNDILEMKRWCTEMANSLERTATQTPPLLPEDQLDELHCIFQYFDTDHDGQLKVQDLIATGFLNSNEVEQIMSKYDVDGDGMLGLSEFSELLCPAGFRAHEQATNATLKGGRRVFFDQNFCRWRLAPNQRL